jgi:hypothetical protein
MARTPFSYQNNPNLPNEQYRHSFTQAELDEYIKCADDPVYFSKKYIKIINVDRGLMPFEMWDFQERMLQSFHDNRFSICKLPRQVGKSTTSVAYILHQVLFNENFVVAILANRAPTARELLQKLKLAFEYLPMFLKQGIKEWNKGSIYLANGSRVLADSTSGSSVRGFSFNLIFLDEFAFVPNNIAEEFFNSTYPTISSGKTSKVVIVSTPNGMNLFYKMWTKAVEKTSTYIPIEIHWSMVPGRDAKWAEETIRNTSQRQFDQEFGCEFLGSSNTLINGAKLASLHWKEPVARNECMDIFEQAVPKHTYVLCADVAEGQGLDYSTFSIFDVSEVPYRQVAKYRNNEISPMLLPAVIYSAAKRYNEAFVLIEINSIGLQVADILHYELNYENLLKFQQKGKQGTQWSGGFAAGKNKLAFGLKITAQSKMIGCANLKTLVESDKLILNDEDTITELVSFSADKKTFKAEEGSNDDLAMTLVHFGWLTAQKLFKETVSNDIRYVLQKELSYLEDVENVPFGFIDNGIDSPHDTEIDAAGDRWVREREQLYPFDDLNYAWDTRL